MTLKNLFDMVKADRYTADGREAIIKAQEAETEDKVYQIGEISQKTGLQKTANGWVKPKDGKQPGAKKSAENHPPMVMPEGMSPAEFMKAWEDDAKKNGFKKGQGNEWREHLRNEEKKTAEYKPSRRVDPKKQPMVSNPNVLGMTANGAKKRFEALGGEFLENKNGVDIFKTRDGDLVEVHYDDNKKVLRTQTTPAEEAGSKPDAADQRDQIGGEIKGNLEAAKYYFDKAQSFSPTDPSYKTYMTKAKQYNDEAKTQADDNGFDFEEMHNAGITQAVNKYAEEQSKPDKVGDFLKAYERGDFGKYQQNAEQRKAESFFKQNKDAAPSLSEIVDRVYNIGEISEKTGLQKTANGWVKPKKGAAPAKKENPTRTFEFKAGPDGNPVAGSGKEVKTYKTKKEAETALKKQNAAAKSKSAIESIGRDEKFNKVRQVLNTALTPSGDKVQMTKSKITGDFHVLLNGKSTGGGFRDPQKAKEEFNAWIAGKKAPSESAKERINKRFDESEARSQKAMESKPEGRNFRSELEANPKGAYDFEKTVEKSIPLSAGDKEVLGNVKSFMREEGTDYKDALKSVATGLVNGNKLHGDWYPEKEKSLLKIAKAVGMDEEVKSYVKTMAKGYDFGYSEDAAPKTRQLTGDTRIRVRKA